MAAMKLMLVLAVFLSGCSIILPKPHDPVMFGELVDVKIAVSQLDCKNKNFEPALTKIERLKVYTKLRNDPQATAVEQLEVAIKKANDSKSPVFCESIVRLNTTRIDVIADAWRGR
jgi:hypothetical protein